MSTISSKAQPAALNTAARLIRRVFCHFAKNDLNFPLRSPRHSVAHRIPAISISFFNDVTDAGERYVRGRNQLMLICDRVKRPTAIRDGFVFVGIEPDGDFRQLELY